MKGQFKKNVLNSSWVKFDLVFLKLQLFAALYWTSLLELKISLKQGILLRSIVERIRPEELSVDYFEPAFSKKENSFE